PEQAVIPARELMVLPAVVSVNEPSLTLPVNRVEASDRVGLDVFEQSASSGGSHWMWLSLICLVGWLITGLLWWHSKRSEVPLGLDASKHLPIATNLVHEREAIKRACIANDAVKARQGLINWSRAMWPDKKFSSLLQLVAHMESDEMSSLATDLDAAIYSGKTGNWDGHVFWEKCSPLLKSPSQLERVVPPLLPELYPQR
ncbi:MAG: hypothetical protein OEX19_10880, partial [Gammaproteobacteria bacterium]|nr:hypothetical protein [Gammaproteobacteria bacterium]